MYAKAHPFGYKPIQNRPRGAKGEIPARKQTVTIKGDYTVNTRNKKGKIVGTDIYTNTETRTITHYDHHKKGRTLAEMVYESMPV